MKVVRPILVLSMAALLVPQSGPASTSPKRKVDCCAFVQFAIGLADALKPGTTRRQVEEHFVQDGGMTFPGDTRYGYSDCPDIKIDVEFKVTDSKAGLPGPDDVVIKVSRPYLEEPSKN